MRDRFRGKLTGLDLTVCIQIPQQYVALQNLEDKWTAKAKVTMPMSPKTFKAERCKQRECNVKYDWYNKWFIIH